MDRHLRLASERLKTTESASSGLDQPGHDNANQRVPTTGKASSSQAVVPTISLEHSQSTKGIRIQIDCCEPETLINGQQFEVQGRMGACRNLLAICAR